MIKNIKIFLFLLSLSATLLMFQPLAQAQQLTSRHSPQLMQGMRPLGMGGAFIAVDGSDENAMFYNPAAINDYEDKIHMQFLLPTVEFSYKAIPFFVSDLRDLASDIDDAATDGGKVGAFDDFATINTGRYEEIGVRGPVAIFMHKLVSGAIFYDTKAVLAILNAATKNIDLEANSTAGLQVGSAYGFFDNNLQIGANLKFVARHLIDETITRKDVINNAEFTDALSFKEIGYGIGGDIGIKARLPWHNKAMEYLDPVFAVTLQDIGDTRFFMGDNVGRIEESLSLGLAVHPDFGKLKSILAMDVRDLDHETDFIHKFHVGYELTWPEIGKVLRSASLRAGMNQGYASGGFGLDFKYFKFNAATYGREIGLRTRQKESRMFGAELAAGF